MVIDRLSFWKNFEDHLQVLTLKFGDRSQIWCKKMVIDLWSFWKNFEDHLQVLTLKFGGRWSIANLVLKNGDRSQKFLEKFWRLFTSFDTQIWSSMIDRKFRVKKVIDRWSFWKNSEDHLQVLTLKFGDRSQIWC